MKWELIFLLLMGLNWTGIDSSCVFESDFGFQFNCGFKKSSLFRIRNLGGVKSYFGLGFSLGDELGFRESLGNLESVNRRSVESGRSAAGYFQQLIPPNKRSAENLTPINSKNNKTAKALGSRRHSNASNKRAVNPFLAITLPPFKPIYPGPRGNQMAAPRLSVVAPMREQQESITVVAVPAFAALPQSIAKVPVIRKPNQSAFQNLLQSATIDANRRYSLPQADNFEMTNSITNTQVQQPLSKPISEPLLQNTVNQLHLQDTVNQALQSVSQVANVSAEELLNALKQPRPVFHPPSTTQAPTTTSTTTQAPTTTTLPPPTMPPPKPNPITNEKYALSGSRKVMNAPKEYYPVGYDKNFDDNFTSKVELPETSFNCGEQKHFPGLYADQDLNCMVFHVCALTDDGLVQKSFLCPESTLFDQTILKCNWWFYVDCKASHKLYDSNIPISKSYQLMKALAFFSTYSSQQQNGTLPTSVVSS